MTILDLIRQMLPYGTEAFAEKREGRGPDYQTCPSWPADLFAVVGSIIDRSGCYTMATPDRADLVTHKIRLDEFKKCAEVWNGNFNATPLPVQSLWTDVVSAFGATKVAEVSKNPLLVSKLLALFAIADETCAGLGWDVHSDDVAQKMFASVVFSGMTGEKANELPYGHTSMCVMVPPDQAIVMPKSTTSSVGCTIRSLSHHLALLPPISVLEPEWLLSGSHPAQTGSSSECIRLLLVPFPFKIHADSFKATSNNPALDVSKAR